VHHKLIPEGVALKMRGTR